MGGSQLKFFLSNFTENVNTGVIGCGEFNGGIYFGTCAPGVVHGAQLAFFLMEIAFPGLSLMGNSMVVFFHLRCSIGCGARG